MAILDTASNAVVIRVVYDGAPLAGKTTSVSALGAGLGASVVTPAEINGRTLYFDWLDYTGGLFEGHRIRCQIVSAPGQASLASRRRRLLESADVVVFVGDSSPAGFEADHSYLRSLCSVLRQLNGPPVGVVLQANKRDLPDAVPVPRMREMLDGLGMKIGVVETVASEGAGIRETFVFAVRLALDRVRELMRLGLLGNGPPAVNSADDLLAEMTRNEGSALDFAAEKKLVHTRLSELRAESEPRASGLAVQALNQAVREETQAAAMAASPAVSKSVQTPRAASGARQNGHSHDTESERRIPAALVASGARPSGNSRPPKLPNAQVASGLVWPPVDGRVILQEISQSQANLSRSDTGDWLGIAAARWRVRAPVNAVFKTVEEGRPALIALARAYATKCREDSIERCAVLADDGAGHVRLWRIRKVG